LRFGGQPLRQRILLDIPAGKMVCSAAAFKDQINIMTSFRILPAILLVGFLSCRCDAITNNVVPTRLYAFTGGADGGLPQSWLIQGSDGNFYGTTSQGGANNTGTVFRMSLGVTNIVGTVTNFPVTTLYSFTGGVDGATPAAGLFEGSDGNFYGMTTRGGINDTGTVFQITSAGTLTTLHGFTGGADGGYPLGGLIQGLDGNFYGTTSEGGANHTGTVFQITAAGTLTSLYSFTGGGDGAIPQAGLVQGTDSNFYGTTSIGGSNTYGTVFSITSNGVFTSIYQINKSDGRYPSAALIQASNGDFFGTTRLGGGRGEGTAFKITSAGTFTALFYFGGGDGKQPRGSLMQAQDGLFYGTTWLGGFHYGTLFQMDSNGVFNTLNSFLGDTMGGVPYGALVQGTDKYFYGTTGYGGPGLHGTVFRFTAFPGGSYTGLALQTNALSAASSGYVSLNLRFTGYFNGSVRMGNKSSTFTGTLNPSGVTTNLVPPSGANPLQIIFELLNLGGGTNQLDGTISNSLVTSTFQTDAAGIFANSGGAFANTNFCPQTGKFNFVIAPATNDPSIPQGFGYGTLSVARLGHVHMTGFLGDGTPFHASGPISGLATFPVYDPLYSKLGSILGRLSFPMTNSFGATMDWFKPATPNSQFYSNAFTAFPIIQGAAYIAPNRGGSNIAGTATVTLANGNLPSNIVKSVVIDSTGSVTVSNPGSDNLTFAIAPASGRFRGTFVHPATSRPVAFAGDLLQTTNLFGAGLFFGTDQTGSVLIQYTP
jgi:uncharacterized repeat protein (TIGR03803 family)